MLRIFKCFSQLKLLMSGTGIFNCGEWKMRRRILCIPIDEYVRLVFSDETLRRLKAELTLHSTILAEITPLRRLHPG